LPPGAPLDFTLAQLEQSRIDLEGGGGPDWLGSGFGSLWVRRDNAVLSRLAPNAKVEATIDAGIWQQPVCQGLGVTAVAVWACATEGKLMRVDPATNTVSTIVPIRKVNEQGRLTAYNDQVWVLTGDGDNLVPVSEESNEPGQPIALDAFCTDVADRTVGSTLWVVCPYDNAVLAVDLAAGRVSARVGDLPKAAAVTANEDVVWVCDERGVTRIDPESATVTGTQPRPIGIYCTLRLQDNVLWLRSVGPDSPFVTGLDATTGEVLQQITAPGDSAGGDILEFAGALWVTSYEQGRVYKMRPPGP
jgi:hypothetical protein